MSHFTATMSSVKGGQFGQQVNQFGPTRSVVNHDVAYQFRPQEQTSVYKVIKLLDGVTRKYGPYNLEYAEQFDDRQLTAVSVPVVVVNRTGETPVSVFVNIKHKFCDKLREVKCVGQLGEGDMIRFDLKIDSWLKLLDQIVNPDRYINTYTYPYKGEQK